MKYLFGFLSICAVGLYLVTSISGFAIGDDRSWFLFHFKTGLLASVLTLFIHSIVMIYFIISHKAVKEGFNDREMEKEEVRQTMRSLKMETIPWTTLGMFLIIGAAILGAAVDTRGLPVWTHSAGTLIAMVVNTYLFWFVYQKLGTNTELLQNANEDLISFDEAQENRHTQSEDRVHPSNP